MVRIAGGVAALAVTLLGARPAAADCRVAAQAELAALDRAGDPVVAGARFTDAGVASELRNAAACPAGKACLIVFFQPGPRAALPTPPLPAEAGYTVDGPGWTPVGRSAAAPDCAELFEFAYRKPALAPLAAARTLLMQAATIDAALAAFKEERSAYGLTPSAMAAGVAQFDISGAAAETLQILGQLVVDRASAKAYGLLQSRLEELLHCVKESAAPGGSPAPVMEFPATCGVLDSLRIQDIAMAPKLLAAALGQDLLDFLGAWQAKAPLANAAVIYGAIATLVRKPNLPQELAVRSVVDELLGYVAQQQSFMSLDPAERAVVLGTIAFAKCGADRSSKGLAACDVAAIIDQLDSAHDANVAIAARQLATRLVAIASAAKTDTPRVQLAADTLLATACMLEKSKLDAKTAPILSCPSVDTISDFTAPSEAVNRIAFVAALVDASLAKDPSRLVVVSAKLLDLALAANAGARADDKRALRLLGGLLDYAATYATPSDAPDASAEGAQVAHEQRTKILESLTDEMSDRTGREGDGIFSIGGALRVALGARKGLKDGWAFFGPLSLPLGFAYTVVPMRDESCGFHMQLDAVDLGNYLALQQGPKVKKPELADAFAPGLTLGAACGTSLPFVIAATGSYTPQFAPNPKHPDKRGSLNFGATFGIHVPLIDMN